MYRLTYLDEITLIFNIQYRPVKHEHDHDDSLKWLLNGVWCVTAT